MRALQCILFSLLLASSSVYADWQLNLPYGITSVSHDIFDLHMTVIWVCVAIGTVVFSIMIYSMIFHRKSVGAKPAQFHEHLWLELTWTIIPFLILVGIAIPGTRVLMNMNDESKPDLTIKVTGYQWKWRYEYIEQGVNFFSNLSTPFNQLHGKEHKNPNYLREVDHPLVVPIHKKIRFLVTSNDVIHAWWVPDLGVKRDAVPGFINETWARLNRPGVYRGQCAELCGMNHGFMPIVVIAMAEKDFDDWVAKQKGLTPGATTPAASTTAVPAPAAAPATAKPTPVPAAESKTAKSKQGHAAAAKTAVPKQASAAASTTATSAPAPTTAPTTATTAPTPASAPTTATPAPAPAAAPTAPPAANTPPAASVQKMALADLMKQGEQVFLGTCAACHQPTGEGMPPTYPALKGSAIAKGPLPNHLNRVLNGKPGTAMQAFRDQFSDNDLAAVITYERNAWGNNTGDAVQPDQVKAAKALPPLQE